MVRRLTQGLLRKLRLCSGCSLLENKTEPAKGKMNPESMGMDGYYALEKEGHCQGGGRKYQFILLQA
jgi:hypothetical protein